MKTFKQFLSEGRFPFKIEKEFANRSKRGIFVPGYDKSLGKSSKWKFVQFVRYTLPNGKEVISKSFAATKNGLMKSHEDGNTPIKQHDGEKRSFFDGISKHKNVSVKNYEIRDEE